MQHSWLIVIAGSTVLAFTAGCGTHSSSSSATQSSPAIAAEPAVAPTPTTRPTGSVIAIGNEPEGVQISPSGVAAVGVRRPDGIALIDVFQRRLLHTVATHGAPRHLELADPQGPLIVALETANIVTTMTFDGTFGQVARDVGDLPHDVVRTADGTYVGTNEHGGGALFLRGGRVVKSLHTGPVQPGGVAHVGNYAAMADVQGHGVYVYDGRSMSMVAHRVIGTRLTHVQSLSEDLVAVADTDGSRALIERITPDIDDVATIPTRDKPYGMAYQGATRTLFITSTASNTLRIVDLHDPAHPRIRGDLPTVQQPNSVAVEQNSGTVIVTGSAPGRASSLQIIAANMLPR